MFEATTARRGQRDVALLALCNALAMTGNSVVIAIVAIVGTSLAPSKFLATAPLTLQMVGTMAAVFPASMLMKRHGRRAGFVVGIMIGIAGSLLAATGVFVGDFVVYCFGATIYGVFMGFVQFYRFAAADAAPPAIRGKAISFVVAGGVAAGLFGPELAIWSRYWFDAALYAGCHLAITALQMSALVLLAFIRIPPPSEEERSGGGRKLAAVARQPVFIVAAMSGMIGYASMSLIMASTPLAILADGHPFEDAAWVIQWHLLGMFAPSFLTGHLIDRFGVLNVIAAGAVLASVCVALNLSGSDLTINFWAPLMLLGISWNFMFVGGSTLLTYAYAPAEKAKVQAANDSLVFSSVALATLFSGATYHLLGWQALNLAVTPLLSLVLVANIWLRRRGLPAEA